MGAMELPAAACSVGELLLPAQPSPALSIAGTFGCSSGCCCPSHGDVERGSNRGPSKPGLEHREELQQLCWAPAEGCIQPAANQPLPHPKPMARYHSEVLGSLLHTEPSLSAKLGPGASAGCQAGLGTQRQGGEHTLSSAG